MTRSATSCSPDDGRGRSPRPRRLSTSVSATRGKTPPVEEAGGKSCPSRLEPEHKYGGLGFANFLGVRGRRAGPRVFFDTIVVCTVTGLPTHAGMIAGFAALELDRRQAPGPRIDARHLGEDPRPGRTHRSATPPSSSRSGATSATTRSRCFRSCWRETSLHPCRVDDERDRHGCPTRGDDHRPRLRRQVAGWSHRSGQATRTSPPTATSLPRTPRRPAGRQCLSPPVGPSA